jgi:GNAT superfamily N-acetyltransferase
MADHRSPTNSAAAANGPSEAARIRRATTLDAELLANHRAAVWHEADGWSQDALDRQIPLWAAFFRAHVARGTYVAFIAEDGERIVGSGGLLVYLAIPRPGSDSDRAGRVQSVYVLPDARRRGIARAVVTRIVEHARTAPLISLVLHPTDQARALYLSLGFESADEMMLRFRRGSPQVSERMEVS